MQFVEQSPCCLSSCCFVVSRIASRLICSSSAQGLSTARVCSAVPEAELLKGTLTAITPIKATFLWKLTARDQELMRNLSLTLPPHVRAPAVLHCSSCNSSPAVVLSLAVTDADVCGLPQLSNCEAATTPSAAMLAASTPAEACACTRRSMLSSSLLRCATSLLLLLLLLLPLLPAGPLTALHTE